MRFPHETRSVALTKFAVHRPVMMQWKFSEIALTMKKKNLSANEWNWPCSREHNKHCLIIITFPVSAHTVDVLQHLKVKNHHLHSSFLSEARMAVFINHFLHYWALCYYFSVGGRLFEMKASTLLGRSWPIISCFSSRRIVWYCLTSTKKMIFDRLIIDIEATTRNHERDHA